MIIIKINADSLLLSEITISNYKTYLNLTIPFNEKITVLVGPNECGKTNLLESINYLKNYIKLSKSDTCLYCEEAWSEEPVFMYKLNQEILGLNNDSNDIQLRVSTKQVEILSPIDLQSKSIERVNIRFFFPKNAGGHIHLKIPPELVSKYKLQEAITIKQEEDFFIPIILEPELNQLKQYNASNNLFKNLQIERVKVKEELTNGKENFLNKLMEKIKIIYWVFDKTKFIQDSLDINALSQKPEEFKYVLNMFEIASIDMKVFLTATDIQRTNMLARINKKVSNLIKTNWEEQNLSFFLGMGKNNTLITSFQENGQNVEPGKRSEGFKWYLSFLLDFNAQFGSKVTNCLILLDEPGIHLHPGGQKLLLKQIEKLAQDNQIIYTTHLPFMINRMFPNRIIYLNKKDGITTLKEPIKFGVFDDDLLSSTLGFDFNSLSRWGDINLFIEGITDELLIKKIILTKAEKDNEIILDLNEISLNPINGANNLENFIRVSQETNSKFLVLLDNDKTAREAIAKYKNRPKLHQKTIDHILLLDQDKEIEDYIPIQILNDSLGDLRNSNQIQYAEYMDNTQFEGKNIGEQIKEIVVNINRAFEERNSEFFVKIEKGDFKLDLVLRVVKRINNSSISEFESLIQKIRDVTDLANKLF